jgi:two-component system alkaline phosphatase synthesis response regulator PhoP
MEYKILVVDDEPDLLKVTLLRLKKTGYEVFGGADGQEGIDLARRIMPDLIILDVYLPVINGDEAAKILKQDDRLKHVPIILISATDVTAIVQKSQGCHADGYLTKPFEPQDLVAMVSRLLGQNKEAGN